MKNKSKIIGTLIILTSLGILVNLFAEDISEEQYQSEWLKQEQIYVKEQLAKKIEEERLKDIQLYFQLGKDYFAQKDYPSAMVSFRKVIALEAEAAKKEYTDSAQEFIKEIEKNLHQEIKQELSQVLKQDWERRKQGLSRILEKMPSDYPKKWRRAEERARRAEIERERRRIKDELERRQLDLEKEILAKRLEIERELEFKRLELIKKQLEIDKILCYAKELMEKRNYSEVIIQADKVLTIDPDNVEAKELKNLALRKMERQKYLREKKEKELREKSERARMREEEKIKKKEEQRRLALEKKKKEKINAHLNKGKNLLRKNQYLKAIEEFKAVLLIEPDNLEAKLALIQIKNKIQEINNALLDKSVSSPDVFPSEGGCVSNPTLTIDSP